MKNYSLIIVFVMSMMHTIASTQNTSNFRNYLDSMFTELDQEDITTGILLDKAVAVVNNMDDYNAINDTLTDFTNGKAYIKA